MKTIRTQIDVDATPATVWSVMTDFDAWPSWNDVFVKMAAEPRLEGDVAFRIHLVGLPKMNISAKMREWEPQGAMAWEAGMSGIFVGHHFFRLEALGESGTRVLHGEDFHGFVPVLTVWGPFKSAIERSYRRFNAQLKERAERDG